MALDSYSSLEVRESATAHEIFWEKGIKWCALKPFQPNACLFCSCWCFFYYKNPKLEDLWLRSVSLFRGIMPVQEGLSISPIFSPYNRWDGIEYNSHCIPPRLFQWIRYNGEVLTWHWHVIHNRFHYSVVESLIGNSFFALQLPYIVQMKASVSHWTCCLAHGYVHQLTDAP